MSSDIEICNVALALVGADEIRAFDKTTKRERLCEIMYNYLVPALTACFDWSFARWLAPLRVMDEMPTTDFGIAYEIPIDCLRALDIMPEGKGQKWEQVGSAIYTSVPAPVLKYIRSVPNAGSLPQHFVNALTAAIAAGIAPGIKQDEKYEAKLKQEAAIALVVAQDADTQIGNRHKFPDVDPENDSFVNPDAAEALVTLESIYVNAPAQT
jgi:hypothetical protein